MNDIGEFSGILSWNDFIINIGSFIIWNWITHPDLFLITFFKKWISVDISSFYPSTFYIENVDELIIYNLWPDENLFKINMKHH